MTDVDRLLDNYIQEHRAGGKADPLEYLDQLEGVDRLELEALIDGYLTHAPPQPLAADAYAGSLSDRVVESLAPSLTGVSGLWPAVLPRLRNRARIRRADLVSRLAATLGVSEREEKVADYYNQMEQGRLPAAGVSGRVLEALGEIVGASGQRLRQLGEAVTGPAAAGGDAPVFARSAPAPAAAPPPPSPGVLYQQDPGTDEAPEWDDVDRLFRGDTPGG
ncbi:MAG: hypothetical protein ACR2LT_00485 [Pyrinomonadaceae bacterium]